MQSFLADDGERLHLRVQGQGAPLLMLHGWTSGHTVWNTVLAGLSAHHRVFCPDARGHGGHALTVTRTPDVARLARDVENLLDHYGLDKVAVAGHSMGALTLWQYIRDHGCERLSHVVILDQSPKLMTSPDWDQGIYGDFDAARSERLIGELEADFAEGVLRLVAHGLNERARAGYERNGKGWQQMRHVLQAFDPEPLIAIWRSLVAADYRDVQPKITVPTLLVWGEESNFYPLKVAQYLLDHLPKAEMVCFEGADHAPQLSHPERFVSDLTHFLARP